MLRAVWLSPSFHSTISLSLSLSLSHWKAVFSWQEIERECPIMFPLPHMIVPKRNNKRKRKREIEREFSEDAQWANVWEPCRWHAVKRHTASEDRRTDRQKVRCRGCLEGRLFISVSLSLSSHSPNFQVREKNRIARIANFEIGNLWTSFASHCSFVKYLGNVPK